MAVEEIEKLVDALSLSSIKKKEYFYRTTDGKEFISKGKADKYERDYLLLQKFKENFSEGKNTFIVGSKELSESLYTLEEESCFEDYFWIKINGDEDKKNLKQFCKNFYGILEIIRIYTNERGLFNADKWIYVIIVKMKGNNPYLFWEPEEKIRKVINIMQNNLPEKIKKTRTIKKIVNRADLIDI